MPKKNNTTDKKTATRRPAARVSARIVPAVRPLQAVGELIKQTAFGIHVHPHLIEIHDAASLAGEAVPIALITSQRPDSPEILAGLGTCLAQTLQAAGIPDRVKLFDAAGNRLA